MRKTKIAGILLAAATSAGFSAASAANDTTMSNFSYDYFEARVGISPVTYGVGFSTSIHPNAHIRAEVDTEFESDFDTTAAIGFHAPVNNWADVYGELGLRTMKQRGKYNHDTEFGVEVNLGLRQWLTPQLEVGAEIGHLSISDDDDIFGSVNARFHATELFSIGSQLRFNEAYGDQFMFTTRFKF
ncbi:hypothetical protein RN22_15440 [Grimontia sp. AD028]|uniref:Outer membrane protein beta-barrel domain-containing protein n=1 Tax=Grimontia indica TaxID=1056512 RepID=R1GN34_9GAMM|nr:MULTISPECIES: outer membrane beta-barrel protein [Grimontia]EOD77573.1 hypothetical protein D515_03697 [Grimontia indica]KKD59570.1 hypothetical protein RN22_15440 [Grimontia sp. AD028]